MRTIIHIQIDEALADIYERLKHFSDKKLYLAIPAKALIFQSSINLKILKKRLEDKGNSLIVLTKDAIGQHLCKQSDIKTMERIKMPQKNQDDQIPDESPMVVEPIQARRNELKKEAPKRVEKKMTIGELLRKIRKKTHTKEKTKELLSYLPKRRSYLFAMVLTVSVGLFFLITYIALPGATIYIHPNFEIVSHAVNVTLADSNKNQTLLSRNEPNVIASQTVSREVSESRFFKTTGTEFGGENAAGKITIINTAEKPWDFVAETRFQSPEGIIFRIKKDILIPSAIRDDSGGLIPSEYEVEVIADPFDRYNDPVGDRGNIEPTAFIVPALSRANQELIWAESSTPMSGGVTSYSKVVSSKDIESAKIQLEDSLIETARRELQDYIEDLNTLNNLNLVLLDDERYLKTDLEQVKVSEELEGSTQEKFEVFAKINAEGIAYDFSQLFGLLKKELQGRVHPNMRLLEDSIQPERVTYDVIEEDEVLGRVKLTVEVEGIQEYEINTDSEAGFRFAEKTKERILNLPLNEAESYLTNLPEVDHVEIKTWPVWVSKMPRVADNIEIKLLEE